MGVGALPENCSTQTCSLRTQCRLFSLGGPIQRGGVLFLDDYRIELIERG